MQVTRDPNAKYFIPNLNEWYKAAYYDPNKLGPGQPGYWIYPTRHDDAPINFLDPAGTNNANFFDDVGTGTGGLTIGGMYYRTEVGGFVSSPSAYGTCDQGGNVSQWNETSFGGDTRRGSRGGGFPGDFGYLSKWIGGSNYPTAERDAGGFRVASSIVPEPGTLLMSFAVIVVGVFCWRRQGR
jgi:formylglycine-generating enzyme